MEPVRGKGGNLKKDLIYQDLQSRGGALWPPCRTVQILSLLTKEGFSMYLTDIVWWGYTAFVVALAVFFLLFAAKVREKGE
jgi:hypothetical protein